MLTSEAIPEGLPEAIARAIPKLDGVVLVALFGSRVNGTFDDQSDLDLLVLAEVQFAHERFERFLVRRLERLTARFGVAIELHLEMWDWWDGINGMHTPFWRLLAADGQVLRGSWNELLGPDEGAAICAPLAAGERDWLYAWGVLQWAQTHLRVASQLDALRAASFIDDSLSAGADALAIAVEGRRPRRPASELIVAAQVQLGQSEVKPNSIADATDFLDLVQAWLTARRPATLA